MTNLLRNVLAVLGLVTGLVGATPTLAFDPNAGLSDADRNVFFFGGRFHSTSFYHSAAVYELPYDDAFFLGAGYQQYFYRSDWSFSIGSEVGLGARYDMNGPASLEAWGGLVFRHDGVVLFDSFRLSPSLTVGFSAATDFVASERERAEAIGFDGHLLVYLGPEVAITPVDKPNIEGFFRVQHRSGGFGLIVDGLNGSNAVNLGVRLKF